jgi:hypothetical protein
MGAAGFGLAYTASHMNSGTASVTPTPTQPSVATTTRTKNKKANKKYTGTIESLGTNSFVLSQSGKKSKTVTVMVDDQTVYNGPGGKISFSSLVVGEMVQVKGMVDSQTQAYTATDVTVTSSGNATPTP